MLPVPKTAGNRCSIHIFFVIIMQCYKISYTWQARIDMHELNNYIAIEIGMPMTADKYRQGIRATIRKLAYFPKGHSVSDIEWVQRHYGTHARTVCYKKMTVIYNVVGETVVIRRVLAGKLLF